MASTFAVRGQAHMLARTFARRSSPTTSYTLKRSYADLNAPAAKSFQVNGDRLWNDIHHTAQWSEPNATTDAGGLSRLTGTVYDKMARDWFKEQVTSLGANTYKVNGTGSQFATFDIGENNSLPPIAMGSHLDSVYTGGRFDGPLGVIGGIEVLRSIKEQGIKTHAPIVLINWTNEEGARFFPFLASSAVYAGQSTVESAFNAKANDGGGDTMGAALESIGYIGDGPNTFEEFPISGHFEIHCEQQTTLEKAGKPVGWVEGWQGIDYWELTFHGEDGHANTYPMEKHKDSMMGAAKIIAELEALAFPSKGYSCVTNIQSGPVGCCNIQSWTRIVFCLCHVDGQKLATMGDKIKAKAEAQAKSSNLGVEIERTVHLEPGKFWPEAIDCVKRACGDRGMGSRTDTAHDSTMTRLKCPTAMVFARAKDGVSHNPKEWTSKEDCAESATVLGKAVLNFDELLRQKK